LLGIDRKGQEEGYCFNNIAGNVYCIARPAMSGLLHIVQYEEGRKGNKEDIALITFARSIQQERK
jgi:hypothetical protein